jgi:hypothetical protein
MPKPVVAVVDEVSLWPLLRRRIVMRKSMTAVIACVFALTGTTQPASAFFFDYQKPPFPIGGDCAAISSQIGPAATWYGEFAGNYYDDFMDQRWPFSARGCFFDEYDCRVWQNDAISYAGRGGIVYMRCTQGLRAGY